MHAVHDVLLFTAGALLVLCVLDAAVRTFVLPRGVVVRLTRMVFLGVRAVFRVPLHFMKTYEQRDRLMAFYAPLSLLILPGVWLVLVLAGYTMMFRAVDVPTFTEAFRTSGSSLFTLGFLQPRDLPGVTLAFSEAFIGLGLLVFLRSPEPNRSWVTAAGAVLDAAAIHLSTIDVPREPQAALLIRAGYLALRPIAEFFGSEVDSDPQPTDPISIARDEFDALYDRMAAAGVPLVADRDQAWRDFAGWRVNYDAPLLALAGLVAAPYAMWSSDRSLNFRRPPLRPTRRRR